MDRQTEGHWGGLGTEQKPLGYGRKTLCFAIPRSHIIFVLHMTLLEKSGIHYPPSAPTFWLGKCSGSFETSSKLRRESAVGRRAARLCVWLLVSPRLALQHHSHQPSRERRAKGSNGPPAAPCTSLLGNTGAVLEERACSHPQIAVGWRKQSLTFIF